jgi:hypothetical protein
LGLQEQVKLKIGRRGKKLGIFKIFVGNSAPKKILALLLVGS